MTLAGWRFPDDLVTQQDVLDIAAKQQRVNFAPGTQWMYSNTGYTLLAVVVERVAGKSLRAVAQDRIFGPLDMRDTHFHDDHTRIVPGRTSAYEPRQDGGWKISVPVFDTHAATSLFTTIEHLLKWIANLDTGQVGGATLLAAAHDGGALADGRALNYGFGLMMGRYRGHRWVGHAGADAGYRADVIRFPDFRLAIAALCNASNSVPGMLTRQVADRLLPPGSEPPVFNPERKGVLTDAELNQRVGRYRRRDSDHVLTLGIRDAKLFIQELGVPLFPVTKTLFDGGTRQVEFGQIGSVDQHFGLSVFGAPPAFYDLLTDKGAQTLPVTSYVGDYVSDELDVRYSVLVRNGQLFLSSRKMLPVPLRACLRGCVYDCYAGTDGAVYQGEWSGKRTRHEHGACLAT